MKLRYQSHLEHMCGEGSSGNYLESCKTLKPENMTPSPLFGDEW